MILFTQTKEDFVFEYFRPSTGAGGQHRDKTSNACRCTHKATGIRASCQEYREQSKNKREAWLKVVNNPKFQEWIKRQALKNTAEVERRVDEMMDESNLLIEYGVEID